MGMFILHFEVCHDNVSLKTKVMDDFLSLKRAKLAYSLKCRLKPVYLKRQTLLQCVEA